MNRSSGTITPLTYASCGTFTGKFGTRPLKTFPITDIFKYRTLLSIREGRCGSSSRSTIFPI